MFNLWPRRHGKSRFAQALSRKAPEVIGIDLGAAPSIGAATFGGLPVIETAAAVREVWIFPDKKRSKRRDRRVIGKYGSLTQIRPAAIQWQGRWMIHPKIMDQLRAAQNPVSVAM